MGLLDWLRGRRTGNPAQTADRARFSRELDRREPSSSAVDDVRAWGPVETIRSESTTVTVNGRKVDPASVPGLREALAELAAGKPAAGDHLKELLARADLFSAPDASGDPSSPAEDPVAARLRRLDQLREAGLVTDDEYARKRQEILDAL